MSTSNGASSSFSEPAVISAGVCEPSTGKHGATVLRGRGRYWAQCACGWLDEHQSQSAGAAAHRWADHVLAANKAAS